MKNTVEITLKSISPSFGSAETCVVNILPRPGDTIELRGMTLRVDKIVHLFPDTYFSRFDGIYRLPEIEVHVIMLGEP